MWPKAGSPGCPPLQRHPYSSSRLPGDPGFYQYLCQISRNGILDPTCLDAISFALACTFFNLDLCSQTWQEQVQKHHSMPLSKMDTIRPIIGVKRINCKRGLNHFKGQSARWFLFNHSLTSALHSYFTRFSSISLKFRYHYVASVCPKHIWKAFNFDKANFQDLGPTVISDQIFSHILKASDDVQA